MKETNMDSPKIHVHFFFYGVTSPAALLDFPLNVHIDFQE